MRCFVVAMFAASLLSSAAIAQDKQYFHTGIQIEVKPGIPEQEFRPPIGGYAYADVKQISVKCFLNNNLPNSGIVLKIMADPNRAEALYIPVTTTFAEARPGGQTYLSANIQPYFRFLSGSKYFFYGEFPADTEGQCVIGMFGDLVPKQP